MVRWLVSHTATAAHTPHADAAVTVWLPRRLTLSLHRALPIRPPRRLLGTVQMSVPLSVQMSIYMSIRMLAHMAVHVFMRMVSAQACVKSCAARCSSSFDAVLQRYIATQPY